MTPMAPLVHLNGSSAQTLLDGYEAASRALSAALTALEEAAPNARDYYPKGDDAYSVARREHSARVDSIRSARADIWALSLSVSEQMAARKSR